MSLEGAKLICLDEAGNHGQIIWAKGRKFTMGYYMNCDIVLFDERALGVHCEIECDALGRVTIRNFSPEKHILVNGCAVEIKRMLLNNTKLSILDKEYLWIFPKSSSNEFEDLPIEATSTPQKTVDVAEQAPISCPDLRFHRDRPKRLTVHNFAYCIQFDEEGNISPQSNNEDTETNQSESEEKVEETQQIVTKESAENKSQVQDLDNLKDERNRSVTPEPNKEKVETPKLNLINCTKDKGNKSTEKKSKQLLAKCHHSDLVITSFSPRETGVKIEKSFVSIVKPKVQVAKSALTPKSDKTLKKNDKNYENEGELSFHTPTTSKKANISAKAFTNSSMHIIDLTTPHKYRAVSPYLKSTLKASAKKNITQSLEKPRTKLAFDEHLHQLTPITINNTSTSETPSSVISVSSSTNNSSVIEELSDGSNIGVTPKKVTSSRTENIVDVASCTFKRTPQSLMKRAILTSAKKQINTQNSRRESINRIPLRTKQPVTPQSSIGNLSLSQLPRRQSMSTPTRKSEWSARRFVDNSSTSKLAEASPPLISYSQTGSTLNILAAEKALSTSTPKSSESSGNSGLRTRRAACKTSPLHKVRKTLRNSLLSSHISKPSVSASKLTSIKNKPPQQVMSDRLITKARKSWCFTPISIRSRDMVANAKTPDQKICPASIQKDRLAGESVKKTERSPGMLFADNNPLANDTCDDDVLSRTFTIDSVTKEITESNQQTESPMNTTFSLEKISSETEKEQQTIETPLDVEEVIGLTKANDQGQSKDKNEKKQTTNKEKKEEKYKTQTLFRESSEVDNKENNTKLSDNDRFKSIVTEESFAEVINDFKEQNNLPAIFEISHTQRESPQRETLERCAENIVRTSNKDIDKTDVAEIGFGEESTQDKDDKEDNANDSKITGKNQQASRVQIVEKGITGDDINTQANEIKCPNAEEINNKVHLQCNEQKSYEYKPIVEDITLEDSVIEKEAKENNKINVSKQPLYEYITLENPLTEDKVKSEEIKEENNEKIANENTDTEKLSSTSTKVCDNLEPIRENDKSENIEKPKSVQNDRETLEINAAINNKKDISQTSQFEICKDNADDVIKQVTQEQKYAQDSESEDQSAKVFSNRVDDNIENTNKLLEEIEDVLNKSDEIKQKQNFIETEVDSETNPLTESTKLLSETSEMLENIPAIGYEKNLKQFEEDQHDSNDEALQISSGGSTTFAQIRQVKNGIEDARQGEEDTEKSAETKIIMEATEEKTKKEILIIDNTSVEREENSTICISQLGDEYNRNTNDSSEKEIPEKIICHLRNIDEDKAEIENVITIVQNIEQPIEEKIIEAELKEKENICAEDIPKPSMKMEEVINEERLEQSTASSQDPNKLYEIINTEITNNETMKGTLKGSNFNKTEMLQNVENTKDLNVVKAKVDSDTSSTPRRSTRRISQSTDTPTSAELSFTPRRSTRRASLSAESTTITCTSTIRTTRRASLSAVNETPLTSKPIVKRRSSLAINSEISQPSTPKAQRAKTPRKQLKQCMVIPEEIYEVGEAIKKDEEVIIAENLKPSQIQIQQNVDIQEEMREEEEETSTEASTVSCSNKSPKEIVKLTVTAEENNEIIGIKSLMEKTEDKQKILTSNIVGISDYQVTEENLMPENQQEICDNNQIKEDNVTLREQQNVEEINLKTIASTDNSHAIQEDINSIAQVTDKLEDSSLQGLNTNANMMRLEEDTPRHTASNEKLNTSADKTLNSPYGTEVPTDLLKTLSCSETSTLDEIRTKETENIQTEVVIEKPDEEMSAVSTSKEQKKFSEEKILHDSSKTQIMTDNSEERQESGETEVSVNILTPKLKAQMKITNESPKTPLMTGMRELLKTPKVEAQFEGVRELVCTPHHSLENENQEIDKFVVANISTPETEELVDLSKTPLMAGIRDLVRTPEQGLENEDEEIEKLAVETDSVQTPATNIPSISTPKTEKHVIDSSKTPIMAGMRELLKTPRAEPQTPGLAGIRDLVRTPEQVLENKDEEIEKVAVEPDFVQTPARNVPSISTPKTKKLKIDSPKTPIMAGMRELLKTPKAEPQTPGLVGIRDLVRTPEQVLENKDEEIEELAVETDFVQTPATNVPSISTPKTEKHVIDSSKTPIMAGMRELLKTPKAEPQTPGLAGIRDLVRTPEQVLDNEDEEIEKVAVEPDFVQTPARNVPSISTPKTKKLEIDSPKTPIMAGMRELLKTPKAEPQTPGLVGIRDLVRTPEQVLENKDVEIEELAVETDFVQTPATSVSSISTPKTKKLEIISPKTPIMAGIRELLKTPKAEPQTPGLAGICDLVRTPKQILENKHEEIEKVALETDFVQTPATNVPSISTPKTMKLEIDSPKTPIMAGMRELLKTPKAEPETPGLVGVRTTEQGLENEDKEIETLAVEADIVETATVNVAEIFKPKTKKHVTIVVDSPKTPIMAGMRELLKTPKKEMITPKLSGIRNLVRTPKFKLEDEQEEIDKLAMVAELIKTPDVITAEDMPTSSIKSGGCKGVKRLLKPQCYTPATLGKIHELRKNPKTPSTPIVHDLPTSTAQITENLKSGSITDPNTVTTLRQVTKMSSTPLLSSGVKSCMDTPAEQNSEKLEQFLKTPTAKNIMIPSMPSSVIMEKSNDSIEISTEYDLNVTNETESPHLEELFKTPMSSRYVERITASYYGQDDELEHNAVHESLQDTLNKSAEEAFDKLIGQQSQIHTPIRKIYTRRSFTLKTPQSQSPFTTSDVLSDLPKTDVEEWIETLEQAEPPIILECDDGEEDIEEISQQDIIVNESEANIEDISLSEDNNKNQSFNESVIPETCTKLYITENNLTNESTATLTYTLTKDPLANIVTKVEENETADILVMSVDAEISGIDLLDQTLESVQEEPSMFEEHLKVSDNDSETENTLNVLQDEGNGLSEPLLLSDSEDLNLSHGTEANNEMVKTTTKNQYEINQTENQELGTDNLDVDVEEKSMLESHPNIIDSSLAADPLESREEEESVIEIKEENKTLVEIDAKLAENKLMVEETVVDDDDGESVYNIDMVQTCDIIIQEQQQSFIEKELPTTEIREEQRLVLDEFLPKQLFATDENIENVKQEPTEVLDIFSASKITEAVLQTFHTNEIEEEFDNNLKINLINENLNTKVISIEETKIQSTETDDIFVDSTVTGICEETSILNEQHVEGKESVETKAINQKNRSYECQNIFMENSNIDESFADEAAASEENSDFVSTMTTTEDVAIEVIKEKDLENEKVAEIVETNKISENFTTVEEAETDYDVIVLEEESTESNQLIQAKLSTRNESEIVNELKQTDTTNSYKPTELLAQIDIAPIEISVTETDSLDEKQQIDSESSDVISIENTEIQSNVTLVPSMTASLDEKDIATKLNKPTEVAQATVALTEYATENEEDMKPSGFSEFAPNACNNQNKAKNTSILFDTSHQPVSENFMSEENVTKSECEYQANETTANAETDKSTPKLIENSEQTPFKARDDKTTKYVQIEKEESETAELNIIEKAEKSPKATVDEVNEVIEETPQPLHTAEDVVKETVNEFEDNRKIDMVIFEIKDLILPSEEASSSLTKTSLTHELPESSTAKVKPLENSTEVLTATYDLEIKIHDLDNPMELELESTDRQSRKDTKSKDSNEEIPKCRKHLKTPAAKPAYCSRDEKDLDERGQENEVFAEQIEINEGTTIVAPNRGGRYMRSATESSQDLTHRKEKSASSRRDRRKIIQKAIEQTFVEDVEEINDQQQIPKDTTPATVEKDEKQKRKCTTSDSSQESAKHDENYGPTRRGGRHKVKKVTIEETVVKQKEDGEELLLPPATEREEQKGNEDIPLTKDITKQKPRLQREIITESNQELTFFPAEAAEEQIIARGTIVEALNEIEKTPDENLNVKKNEEKQTNFTKELHPDSHTIVSVTGLSSVIESEEHLTLTPDQVSIEKETILSASIKEAEEHSNERPEEIVIIPRDVCPKADTVAVEVKDDYVKNDEFKYLEQATVSAERRTEIAVEESLGDLDKEEMTASSTVNEMHLRTEENSAETGKEQLIHLAADEIVGVKSVTLKIQEETQNLVHAKAKIAESRQVTPVPENDTKRTTRRGRKVKVQKPPTEEIAIEEKTCEPKFSTKPEENKELSNEKTKNKTRPAADDVKNTKVELKESEHGSVQGSVHKNQEISETAIIKGSTKEISIDHKESKDMTYNREQNKSILPEAVVEEPITVRKGRRKIQTLTAEIQLESDVETNEVENEPQNVTIAKTEEQTVQKVDLAIQEEKLAVLDEPPENQVNSKHTGRRGRGRPHKIEVKERPVEKAANEQCTTLTTTSHTKNLNSIQTDLPLKGIEAATNAEEPDKIKEMPKVVYMKEETQNDRELLANEPSIKETVKRGRSRKQEVEKEITTQHTRRGGRHITSASETSLTATLPKGRSSNRKNKTPVLESRNESDINEKPAKKRAKHQINESVESLEENANITTTQILKTENLQSHEEQDKSNKGIEEKQQKTTTTRRRAAATAHEERAIHKKESETQEIQTDNEENEKEHSESMEPKKTTIEDVLLSKVQITEVNLEPEESFKQNASSEENQTGDKIKRRRRKDIFEENLKADHEILSTTKKRAAVTSIKQDHDKTKTDGGQEQKNERQEVIDEVTAIRSPKAKRRGRKPNKVSNTETLDHTTKEQQQRDESLTKEPEMKANTEKEIQPQGTAPVARKGRKAVEHITAESQEFGDTPGKRARNVPQRRAATAYHNYDETSDSEVITITKKKTDTPRKSLEAVNTTPSTVTITSAVITTLTTSPVSITPVTTARGRTRKPTAKVQQFLEKQRAKAETPKKRGMLAAVAGNDTSTPLGTPARRGRKPSNIATEIEETLQGSKPRGKEKLATASHNKEDLNNVPETATVTTVIEEKEIEVHATPTTANTAKGRRRGRKAKITEEQPYSSEEPPAKKSPLELENEKQCITPLVDTATPTRSAGRRNAAAAAKARIEEDALAAAAIEPPKRARAKKVTNKISTPLTSNTDIEVQSSEVDEEQSGKEEKMEKNKNPSQLQDQRLASASTIEGVEDDIEMETKLKTGSKRGRKAATAAVVTDSQAVPAKRGRKAKILEEVTESETPVEPKTSRGRGRGRKNVHFDEHNEHEASSSNQKTANDNESSPVASTSSEPAKKSTRTRRK